jgi:hypothetical protein
MSDVAKNLDWRKYKEEINRREDILYNFGKNHGQSNDPAF